MKNDWQKLSSKILSKSMTVNNYLVIFMLFTTEAKLGYVQLEPDWLIILVHKPRDRNCIFPVVSLNRFTGPTGLYWKFKSILWKKMQSVLV